MKKPVHTGLLSGSFNPVHIGHLIIANYFTEHVNMDEVWFVLSPQNPLKGSDELLGEQERMDLLELAVAENPKFRICDIELGMPKPSYTIDTIKQLKTAYPDRHFTLLIGSDNLEVFDKWKDHKEILESIEINVYPRSPGFDHLLLQHHNVRPVHAPLLEVSSTAIRRDISAGKSPRYLVPEKVFEKIMEQSYYRRP
ncbi:MAG: nicotinate-nucleotide adenylyltransferase [Bacteroidia bacterium]|nr:MAG: nicotinate-nucleotide adenylyltransferase [Bacteroidia bacterium]